MNSLNSNETQKRNYHTCKNSRSLAETDKYENNNKPFWLPGCCVRYYNHFEHIPKLVKVPRETILGGSKMDLYKLKYFKLRKIQLNWYNKWLYKNNLDHYIANINGAGIHIFSRSTSGINICRTRIKYLLQIKYSIRKYMYFREQYKWIYEAKKCNKQQHKQQCTVRHSIYQLKTLSSGSLFEHGWWVPPE